MPRSFLITNRRYRAPSSAHVDDVNDDVDDDISCSPSSSWSPDDRSQDSTSTSPNSKCLPCDDDIDRVRLQNALTPYNRQECLVPASPTGAPDVMKYWDNCRQQMPFFDHLLPMLLRRVAANAAGSVDAGSRSLVDGGEVPGAGGDLFACSDCTKRYSSASNLARHRVIHQRPTTTTTVTTATTDRRVSRQCPHCAKVYTSIPAYSMHVRTHTQGCACPHCGKRFSRPWLLQGHVRTHTGERPFRCPQCSKTFADKSNLRAHVQTHSAHKPYSCARCGKAFALKSYLYKHEESSCMRTGLGVTTTENLLKPQQLVPVTPLTITSAYIGRA